MLKIVLNDFPCWMFLPNILLDQYAYEGNLYATPNTKLQISIEQVSLDKLAAGLKKEWSKYKTWVMI